MICCRVDGVCLWFTEVFDFVHLFRYSSWTRSWKTPKGQRYSLHVNVLIFFESFACYSCRKSDGLLSQLRTFPSLLPSPSRWMAQDDTLAVLVLSTFLYPINNKQPWILPFFSYPKHDLEIGRSIPPHQVDRKVLEEAFVRFGELKTVGEPSCRRPEAAARGQV